MNTLFLRLEGPIQSWGDTSKLVVRSTKEAPTKSGILGLLCAALGVSREDAPREWLPKLTKLNMGVRIDKPGSHEYDFNTIGAGMMMPTAEGKPKPGALLSLKEYLYDASFLVALQGDGKLIDELREAVARPVWTLYLGRKSCVPSRRLLQPVKQSDFPDIESALSSVECVKREQECLIDWQPTDAEPYAPSDAEVWYDVPVYFNPPVHQPRFVVRKQIAAPLIEARWSYKKPTFSVASADMLAERRTHDNHSCVFCKDPGSDVHHVTYERYGHEQMDDLRTLCRTCHNAVTAIEYEYGMGRERIDPCDITWRDMIIERRDTIRRP